MVPRPIICREQTDGNPGHPKKIEGKHPGVRVKGGNCKSRSCDRTQIHQGKGTV